ncbi:MAG: hypothetical protein UCN61_04500, partial [Ruminococcus sp.]|nr:hypothetical protein [Ruminococcus sp.]
FKKIQEEAEESYVHIIKDVSEDHSNSDAPLKKIHSEGTPYRGRHYIEEEPEEDVKEYKKSPQPKNGTGKYTANRKF